MPCRLAGAYLGDNLRDRICHGARPILRDAMAAAIDHQVAAAWNGSGQVFLQTGPVCTKPPREAPGSAEHHDWDVRKRPADAAQFPQHCHARRSVTVAQLSTPGRGRSRSARRARRGRPGVICSCAGSTSTSPATSCRRRQAASWTKIAPQLCPASTQGPAAAPVTTDSKSRTWRARRPGRRTASCRRARPGRRRRHPRAGTCAMATTRRPHRCVRPPAPHQAGPAPASTRRSTRSLTTRACAAAGAEERQRLRTT